MNINNFNVKGTIKLLPLLIMAATFALNLASHYLQQSPTLSMKQLYKKMQSQTTDLGKQGKDPQFGWGLIQAKSSCKK